MTVLDHFDATRIAARSGAVSEAWARPAPTRRPSAAVAVAPFSWRAWATNPNALLLTGLLSTMAARDAVVRVVSGS